MSDAMKIDGRYTFICHGPDGKVKWTDEIGNVVMTVGRNLMLGIALAGSGVTGSGPFMGLISSISYGAGPVAADTMASHAGWTEAGNANAPTYSGNRRTCVWAAASAGAIAIGASLVFNITSTGTVKGGFIVFGAGSLNTIDNTAGTLYSGGLFSGGDKAVGNGDTLSVTYTTTLT
jgi:hypothetical protein